MALRPPPSQPDFTGHGLLVSSFALGVRQALVAGLTAVGVLALSHILSPPGFAYFGWTIAVATIVSAIGDLGYGAALIRSGQARRLARPAIGRQLRRLLPAAVLALGAVGLLPLNPTVKISALLLVVAAGFLAAQTIPCSVFEAEGRFGAISAIEVVQRALLMAAAVTLAVISARAWATPAAGAIAAVVGCGLALGRSRISLRRDRREPAPADGLDLRFSRHWLQGRIANQINYAVYPLVGTAFLSSRQLGLVLWALSVSALPALGGQLSARVLFPAMVARRVSSSTDVHRRVICCLLALGGPVVSAMVVFAHPLTLLLFGRPWLPAVVVLQLECVITLLGLILTPTAPVMYLVAEPRSARTLMVAYAVLTTSLALALIAPLGLTAISIATLASSAATVLTFDAVLRRHGHPGLGFVLGGLLALGAVTAVGLAWNPAVSSLAGLGLTGAAWVGVVFALMVVALRLELPWQRVSGWLRARARMRLLLHPGAELLLAAGAVAVLLAPSGVLGAGELNAGWWVAGGFAACAVALAAMGAPTEGPTLALVFAVYVGISAVLAAAHPAHAQLRVAQADVLIAPHVFRSTLALGAAAGLLCLAGLVLATRLPLRLRPAAVFERRRLGQAANLLVWAGAIGALLAALRFAVQQRTAGFSATTLQSFWHGGAYLIFLAQLAIPGFGLQLSLRLDRGVRGTRLLGPIAGLAALMVLSLPTGERGFLIEGGLVVSAVALAHVHRARLLLVPMLLAGLCVLGVTQAARDALNEQGSISPANIARQLAPNNWTALLENQFASFQWAADVDAYGPQLHATNPLLALLAKPIPRQIYPGKPEGLGQRFTEVVYPSAANAGVHFAVPIYAELAYATGGLGALAGLALLGALVGIGWRFASRWPKAVRPVARLAFLWAAFVLVRGDLNNSVPAAAAWLIPLAFVLWWARVERPDTLILDALAVPARYSGVGETVRRVGESLSNSGDLPYDLVVRCPADVRAIIAPSFPAGARIDCPLASSRPVWRRLAYQLVIAPLREQRSAVLLSASEIASPWGRSWRGVIVHDVRRLAAPDTVSPLERCLHNTLVPRGIRGADALLAVSHTTERSLREVLDPTAPVSVVAPHHGLRIRRPAPEVRRVLVVVSAVRQYKGLDLVLDALESLVPADRPPVRWVGAMELGPAAAAPLVERARQVNLELLGWVGEAELEAILDSAAVLLVPSRFEGYGLSLLEGLRRGKLILASDIPSHREVAAAAAIFFDPGDRAALARKLAELNAGRIDLGVWAAASYARAAELAGAAPSWAEALADLVATLADATKECADAAGAGAERD